LSFIDFHAIGSYITYGIEICHEINHVKGKVLRIMQFKLGRAGGYFTSESKLYTLI
jgi:hypothetical protein